MSPRSRMVEEERKKMMLAVLLALEEERRATQHYQPNIINADGQLLRRHPNAHF